MSREPWVDQLLGNMSVEEKVGQLMVLGHAGAIVTPMTKELITKYHVGGFRIAQKFYGGSSETRGFTADEVAYSRFNVNTFDVPKNLQTKRINCTPTEYVEQLNYMRDLALDRKNSVGLHFAYDQEGEGADMLFQQRLFAYPMGIAAAGDKELATNIGYAAGRQAAALGANMIHSPVLDINTNPLNPEIGPRSYSANVDIATEFAIASMQGYAKAGIICTGKHYPGRGASTEDAHFGLPSINLSKEELYECHLKSFRKLIDAGLPAIMAAFTAYPALGGGDIPAATNPEIMTNILRNEFNFQGVVTTDNVQMRGLLNKYELSEAVLRCLNAGCDLVLFRSESPATIYVIEKVIEAIREGRYSMEKLDASVKRILTMRYNMGLHVNGGKVDATKAGDLFHDPEVKSLAVDAANRTTFVIRDEEKVLPVSKEKKVLLIEQIHHFHSFINTMYSHPGVLWEEMRKHSDNVSTVLINESFTEEDKKAVLEHLKTDDYDMVVTTSYYNYRSHGMMMGLLPEIFACGKPVLVVTNNPYEKFGVPAEAKNAMVNFCPSGRENIAAIAKYIFEGGAAAYPAD